MARVIPFDELEISAGAGWCEMWYPADEEEGEPECFVIFRCAYLFGSILMEDGGGGASVSYKGSVREWYNKKYGGRVWTDPPSEQDRKEAKWE